MWFLLDLNGGQLGIFMKNDINEERIIDMLCSKDIELKRMGINLIKSNYKIPDTMYINSIGPLTFSPIITKHCDISIPIYRILQNIQETSWRREWTIEFLNAILDYTEAYGYAFN